MTFMTANELRDVERQKLVNEKSRQSLYVAPPSPSPAEAAQQIRARYRLDTERIEGREARLRKPESEYSDPELWGL